MTPEETVAVANRWHLDLIQAGNVAQAGDMLTPDVVVYANGQEVRGLANVTQLAIGLRAAVPDIEFTHDETLVAGDRVAIRWTNAGTHLGPYFGVPASGSGCGSRGWTWSTYGTAKSPPSGSRLTTMASCSKWARCPRRGKRRA